MLRNVEARHQVIPAEGSQISPQVITVTTINQTVTFTDHDESGEATVGLVAVFVPFKTPYPSASDYDAGIMYACSADRSHLVRVIITDRAFNGLTLVADEEGALVTWEAKQKSS